MSYFDLYFTAHGKQIMWIFYAALLVGEFEADGHQAGYEYTEDESDWGSTKGTQR